MNSSEEVDPAEGDEEEEEEEDDDDNDDAVERELAAFTASSIRPAISARIVRAQ